MKLVLKDSQTTLWAKTLDISSDNFNISVIQIQEILDRTVKEIEAKNREMATESEN